MVENAIFLQIFQTAANSGNQKPQPPKHHHNNNKNQNHTENTFSHLPNRYIISSLNSETQIKPRKKKIIIRSNWVKKEERENDRFWGQGWSVLGCDDRDRGPRIWVCDRGPRIGPATAIAIDVKVKSNGEVEGCDSKSNGEVEVK